MFRRLGFRVLLAHTLFFLSFPGNGVGDAAWAGEPVTPVSTSTSSPEAQVKSEPTSSLPLPTPQIEVLPNGLEVVWFLNDRLPILDLAVLVQAGHRDDPKGLSGVSELLAASLARGAAGQTAEQIARATEILGASHYEMVDGDSFTVGIHGLSPDSDQLIDWLGKVVTRSDLSESEVMREKARIIERWQHIGDYSEALAGLAYQRILSMGTPYGRGSLLSLQEFKNVKTQDVRSFYRNSFTPKNSVLMVVGRVDQAKFRSQILSALGKWKGEAPKREKQAFSDLRFAFSPQLVIPSSSESSSPKSFKGLSISAKSGTSKSGSISPKILLMDRPGLSQAQVRLGFQAPLVQIPEHHALIVGNALLGEYFESRLNSLIRDQLGLTYGIHSGFSYSKDLADFIISSATRNESVGQLIQKTITVLEQLKKGPIEKKEVEAAKTYLIGGFPLSTSTLQAVASKWLAGRVLGMGPTYLNEYMSRIQKVTLDEVQAAIQKYFDLNQLVIVVSGDAKAIRTSLSEAGLIPLKQLRASDLN